MEPSASIESAKHVLLVFGIILAAGALSGLLAQKLKVPDVVVFLITGILLGPEVLPMIDISADSALNQLILIFGSCYILFDGGASLRLSVLKEVWITLVVIATVGVLIMTAVTGLAAYYILGVPLIVALLLGATIASTDPATLVPIFKQVHIKDRVSQTVMSESAFNDAMGAIITFSILGIAMGSGGFYHRQGTVRSCLGVGPGHRRRRRSGVYRGICYRPREVRLSGRVCSADNAHGGDRRLSGRRRPSCQRIHGGIRFRRHVWKTRMCSVSAWRTTKRKSSRNSF